MDHDLLAYSARTTFVIIKVGNQITPVPNVQSPPEVIVLCHGPGISDVIHKQCHRKIEATAQAKAMTVSLQNSATDCGLRAPARIPKKVATKNGTGKPSNSSM
jgi:hypothetical protein